MFRNIAVYVCLALSMLTVLADDNYPVLEFLKDGKVIETRTMTHEEYAAYTNLKKLEIKIEKLEQPLAEFQKYVDVESARIEAEALEVVEQTLTLVSETGSLADLSKLSELSEMNLEELNLMQEKLQPMIDEITGMSDEISDTALKFQDALMKNFDESDLDEIRIKGSKKDSVILLNSKKTFSFNK